MIYEYECGNCGNVVEIERKITDPESEYDCPNNKCGTTLTRIWNSPSISFNAPGFYSSDNRK